LLRNRLQAPERRNLVMFAPGFWRQRQNQEELLPLGKPVDSHN